MKGRIGIKEIDSKYYVVDNIRNTRYLLTDECCLIKQISDIYDIIIRKEDKNYETSRNKNRKKS